MIFKLLSLLLIFLSFLNLDNSSWSRKVSYHLEKEKNYQRAEKKVDAENYKSQAVGALLFDLNNQKVLWSQEAESPRHLASLTKLMSALVFLDHLSARGEYYKIKAEDISPAGGRAYIFVGDEVKKEDLLSLALVASENSAALSLAGASGLSQADFVLEMNKKAQEFGMFKSNFSDPSGLGAKNISTAREVAILATKAFANPEIKKASEQVEVEIFTLAGKKITAPSTNKLLRNLEISDLKIEAGKTGYTPLAGYCFVAEFKDITYNRLLTVVLGAGSEKQRFQEREEMLKWFYLNHDWK